MENKFEKLSLKEQKELIKRLTLKTEFLIRNKKIISENVKEANIKGKSAEDYAIEGILQYLEHPEKYKYEKGGFENFIFYFIIRNLVGKDLRSLEIKRTKFFENELNEDKNLDEEDNINKMIFKQDINTYYEEDNIDFKEFMEQLQEEVKEDKIEEEILIGILMDYKRKEIIDEFGMNPKEFDNGKRRLINKILKIKKEVNIN